MVGAIFALRQIGMPQRGLVTGRETGRASDGGAIRDLPVDMQAPQ